MGGDGPALERAFRADRAVAVAAVARRVRDLDVAEDAVSEAFARAVVAWREQGAPSSPRDWLVATAWRCAVDRLRREQTQAGVVRTLAAAPPSGEGDALDPALRADLPRPGEPLADDLLRLVLLCCHPALAPEAQVALTARTVLGLSVEQVARALLLTPDAAARRLVRARRKVRDAGIPFALPNGPALGERLDAARLVVHVLYTEGHSPTSGDLVNDVDLEAEALWLARLLHRLVPSDVEGAGLLALLLLTAARGRARTAPDGRVVLLADQDRSRWDAELVAEGLDLLATARRGRVPGRFWLEAEVAAEHARAPSVAATDWVRVAALLRALERLTGSPVVAVSLAVAIGRADGPAAGLAALRGPLADPRVTGTAALHAAHADLLERAGQAVAAREAWRRATAATAVAPYRVALAAHLVPAPARSRATTAGDGP